jgi:hypothetical protein
MKSYGRAPTFLLATGHEQVRSIVAALVGDHEAAARVELHLPETGVCTSRPIRSKALDETGAATLAEAGAACCGTGAPPEPMRANMTKATNGCCAGTGTRPEPIIAAPAPTPE